MQLRAKRHFVHEHPRGSKASNLPDISGFLMRPGVDSVEIDLCAFGMTSSDNKGAGLAKKPTRITSSQAESTHERHEEQQPSGKVDLEDENNIQLDQAEPEVPEDPLMKFQQMDSSDVKSATADAFPAPPTPSPGLKPATAEVHSADNEAEFAEFQAYLQEHVPYWTTEPDVVEWCDPENPEKSLQ